MILSSDMEFLTSNMEKKFVQQYGEDFVQQYGVFVQQYGEDQPDREMLLVSCTFLANSGRRPPRTGSKSQANLRSRECAAHR